MQPKYIMGPGEYNCWIINNGQVYDVATGLPTRLPGQPLNVIDAKGCLHHQILLTSNDNLYLWGKSAAGETGQGTVTTTNSPVLVGKDGNGNVFGQVKQAVPYCNGIGGNGVLILKKDGTVWIMGNTQTGMRGDGSQGNFNDAAPVQVPLPSSAIITKICAGIFCAALDSNGNVWTWGGGGTTGDPKWWPTYLLARMVNNPEYTIPMVMPTSGPVADICAGGFFNYAILKTGSLIGWAYYSEYLTGSPSASPLVSAGNTNVVLDKFLNLPKPVASIFMSTVATYAILTDGTLWAWGDNACGCIGNGKELDFAKYKTPYAWDWGRMELSQSPVQIGAGLTFANVSTGLGDVFYAYAEDVNGNLYSWGRNKNGGMLGNGVVSTDPTSNLAANLPNSWDVPWITPVNPFALTSTKATTSPMCITNPSTPFCSPVKVALIATKANVGFTQTVKGTTATLDATGSTGTINYYLWSQVSGPNIALITLPSSPLAAVSGLVAGIYVFQLMVTDNQWKTSLAATTVYVQAAAPCPTVVKVSTTITWSDGSTTMY